MPAIAIIGMGCRFAGAPDLQSFWEMSLAARDAMGPVPPDRWPDAAFRTGDARDPDLSTAPAGGFIEDIRSFPALALGIPPRRVEVMDPQQRLSLEVAIQAIEDAGLSPDALPRRTGVFMGVTALEYRTLMSARGLARLMAQGYFGRPPEDLAGLAASVERLVPPRPYTAPGGLGNMIASVVAQELDLHGPAYSVDSACASALIAVSDAVSRLRSGDIDAAIAGGVYLCLTPEHHIAFSRVGAMSTQGRCLPFDAQADGFTQGDGGGTVLLKRLDDALRDGDRVHAVIEGFGVGSDGHGDGPMAPVKQGQIEVIERAWRNAGLDPAHLGYLEAHGTGTQVGDHIEFSALLSALGGRTADVALGSSKANVGHTMSAAGIAGLIRAALSLSRGMIPPMAGFQSAKPDLQLEDSSFRVPTHPEPWTRAERLAAVSSFGFGGTNAHAILSGPQAVEPPTPQPELVLLSAPTPEQLTELAARTAAAIRADPLATVAGVARAAAVRRPQSHRLALVATELDDLLDDLDTFAGGQHPSGVAVGQARKDARLAMLFPGQGSQRTGMLAGIRDRFPVVAEALDEAEGDLDGLLPVPLTHLLYPERRGTPVSPEQAEAELQDTAFCQPVMLAVGTALTRLLAQVGVQPQVVTGHSLGEFTAATVGGLLPLADALRFVTRRGQAMAAMDGDHGTMAALMTDRQTAAGLLVDGAVIANFNHPRQVVVSGTTPAVGRVVERARAAHVKAVPLRVSHAFHSPVLGALDLDPLVDALEVHAPTLPVVSASAARLYVDADDAREVFRDHARSAVHFEEALTECQQQGANVFLDVSAGGPLAAFARGTIEHRGAIMTLAPRDDSRGATGLLETLGRLWCLGVSLDPRPITAPAPVVSLPPSVLPRQTYWAIQDRRPRPLKLEGIVVPAAAPAPTLAASPPAAVEDEAAPPVADEVTDEVTDKVLEVISQVSAYPREALRPDLSLSDDLGFDSLMVNDLAAGLAKAFPGMPALDPQVFANRLTVADLLGLIQEADKDQATAERSPLRAYRPTWVPAPLSDERRTPRPGRALILGTASPMLWRMLNRAGLSADAETVSAVVLLPDAAEPTEALIHALDTHAGDQPDVYVIHDRPALAGAAAVARTVAAEWPGSRGRSIEVPEDTHAYEWARLLMAELRATDRTPEVRYSQGLRQARGFVPLDYLPPQWAPSAHERVLITGGGGSIGLALAQRLIDAGATVLLANRSPASAAARQLAATAPERVGLLQVDVTDTEALRRALAPWAPVTALVHAAGVLADGPLGQDLLEAGRLARHVKLDGWTASLAACGDTLGVALAMGSWAGRFGSPGQAHYAAANALLAANPAPRTPRTVVVEFGPWEGSAMGQRLSAAARAALSAQGERLVDMDAGVDAILTDLGAGQGVVTHGHALPPTTRHTVQADTLTARSHPYLRDHAIEGTPVLPMAAALDLLAHAGQLSVPFTATELNLVRGVTVSRDTPIELEVRATHAELRLAQGPAWRATLTAGADPLDDPGPSAGGAPGELDLRTFYDTVTFHGPLLQGIVAVDAVGADFIRGRVRGGTPRQWIPASPRRQWAADPLALDSAFQLAAYFAWTRFGRAGTPVGIGRYRQFQPPPSGELQAEVRLDRWDGDRFHGTVILRDADARVVAIADDVRADMRVVGDRFVAPPQATDVTLWPELQALQARFDQVEAAGLDNPYFAVHQGVAAATTQVGERELINYSSYNYLGLSGDPRVSAAARQGIERYGTSVSASRIASGERPYHAQLEAGLAKAQGAEDALVFTAGHATNVTTVGHLMRPGDLIVHDELIHDSILQGIKLSGAARRAFAHADHGALDRLLRDLRPHHERCLILAEGVYSMDGDACDLPTLVRLKRRHGCLLMVDEAHSFGILGAHGRGVGEHWGVDGDQVDIWMGTLSKSLASVGGWIAGRAELIRYLRYTAPGFVYSAGIPAATGMAALEALRILEAEPERVQKLQANARHFHTALQTRGLDVGPAQGESGVIPVITGNSDQAMALSQGLLAQGINVQPIVYPAVADDAARLRFFLSSTHTTAQLDQTAQAVSETLAAIREGNA